MGLFWQQARASKQSGSNHVWTYCVFLHVAVVDSAVMSYKKPSFGLGRLKKIVTVITMDPDKT